MGLLNSLIRKTEKIDFKFPNNYDQLMNDSYYDYEKFEIFLTHVFKLENHDVQRVAERGKGDSGADLILTHYENNTRKRIGIQAKYWKNRVGVTPIRELSNTNIMLGLDVLWIITTSDLTADAQREAEKLNIKVLRKEDVIGLIDFVKSKHKNDMELNGESNIEFLPIETKINKINKTKEISNEISGNTFEELRKFRQELAKKYKVGAVYHIFNNDSLNNLIEANPKTISELSKVKGFGPVTIEKYGLEIIDFLNKKSYTNPEQEFREFLIEERIKISKYNKISIENTFNDQVIENIIKLKPTSINTLKKVYGIKPDKIELFGNYLVNQINKFINS